MSFYSQYTKSLIHIFLVAGISLATGCVMDQGAGSQNGLAAADDVGNDGWADLDDCKVENDDIGVIGLSLDIGNTRVSFAEWIEKDGEPGEYVGFRLELAGAERLPYIVKAAGERYHSDSLTWDHPNGSGGSEASGISHVDFCENDPGDPNDPIDDPTDPTDPNDPVDDPNDPVDDPNDPTDPNDPGCTDPNGCVECSYDADCGPNEFCDEYGVCAPIIL
jgi:hypothetical protein